MKRLRLEPEPQAEEKLVREKAKQYADKELRPFAIEDDEKSRFRRDAFNKAAQLGLTSIVYPKKYGGQESTYQVHYAAIEEIARASASMAVVVAVTNLVQGAVYEFGSEEQKSKYLVPLLKGESLGAFSLSEPNAGSDAAALRTSAKPVKGGYNLTGTKVWCTSAGHADLYLVMARTGTERAKGITSFLVPKDTPGFRVGKQEKKLGVRASSLAELIFEDCFIPESQRLGKEGDGLNVALSQLDGGRITVGCVGVAIALEAMERTWVYHKNQEKAGIPFEEGVQQLLAAHFAQTQAVRLLLKQAAEIKQQKQRITTIASQLKLLGSNLAMQVSSDCITFLGERGGTRELEVERLLRDAKALQIFEGANQVQCVVLAREMDKMLS